MRYHVMMPSILDECDVEHGDQLCLHCKQDDIQGPSGMVGSRKHSLYSLRDIKGVTLIPELINEQY